MYYPSFKHIFRSLTLIEYVSYRSKLIIHVHIAQRTVQVELFLLALHYPGMYTANVLRILQIAACTLVLRCSDAADLEFSCMKTFHVSRLLCFQARQLSVYHFCFVFWNTRFQFSAILAHLSPTVPQFLPKNFGRVPQIRPRPPPNLLLINYYIIRGHAF